jgi:hypothetical protein
MRFTYDLTGDSFERWDFEEAIVAFPTDIKGLDSMAFGMWGITLHATRHPLPSFVPMPPPKERATGLLAYGWSMVKVIGIREIVMRVQPYIPKIRDGRWAFDIEKNSQDKIERVWSGPTKSTQLQSPNTYRYEIGGTLAHPHGILDLSIVAEGAVSIEIDATCLVPMEAVQKDRKRYTFESWLDDQFSWCNVR